MNMKIQGKMGWWSEKVLGMRDKMRTFAVLFMRALLSKGRRIPCDGKLRALNF